MNNGEQLRLGSTASLVRFDAAQNATDVLGDGFQSVLGRRTETVQVPRGDVQARENFLLGYHGRDHQGPQSLVRAQRGKDTAE